MNETDLFAPMSPSAFAPFDGFPGTCAAARDASMKLLWCNDEYCKYHNRSREELLGTNLDSLFTPEMAREREEMIRPVLEEGRIATYAQLSRGARWLTRVWPLDPKAFNTKGVFIVLNQSSVRRDGMSDPAHAVQLARCADLGDLEVLTPREMEVFYYLAAGMTVADIGELMHRSPKTVERHLESLHRKMGFKNRAELVRLAVERGLVQFTAEEWAQFVSRKRDAG
jgi:DNA-binding CsgD family transcriptional regulator